METWFIHFPGMDQPNWEMLARYTALPPEGKRRERYLDAAKRAFDVTQPMLTGSCVCTVHQQTAVRGDTLEIQGAALHCPLFANLQPGQISGVWVYFIRTDFQTMDRSLPMLVQTFADVWATVYLDICRNRLENILSCEAAKKNTILSPCFGPGYYGMPTEEMKQLYTMSKPGDIQLFLTPAGTLSPAKSTSGLYMSLLEAMIIPSAACKNCIGDRRSCGYCRIHSNCKGSVLST